LLLVVLLHAVANITSSRLHVMRTALLFKRIPYLLFLI
jgi:hypothetical protein